MTGRKERLLRGKPGAFAGRALRRAGVFFFLIVALPAPAAWGQRIGPLIFDDRERSKAAPVEQAATARPPSLGLRLPAPAAALLPPLGPDDLERLRPQQGLTPVGVHRSLPAGAAALSFSGGAAKTTVARAWQATAVGRLWRLRVTSPGARALRVRFQDFDVGAGSVWLHAADGQIDGPYSGRGTYGDGDFWSGIVFSESATLEYRPDPAAPAEEAAPFRIAAIGHIWGGHGLTGNGNPPSPDAKAQSKTKNPGGKPVAGEAWKLAGRPSVPPKNTGGPLAPGQPADFRLGPVGSPTLFNGEFSFRLEVPAGAARVALDLAAVDPDVDVDLYVRFGRDNELQDGQVVRDHASRGSSGNERIVITRYSNPPLQTGTWFVSLLLYDTNAAAEGTLTATLGFDEEPPPVREVGGPLTPGQPAAFRLGPVGSSTLFNGEFSFRLEVPADAARVTFDLTAVDPDVDVDLYVRFGRDNELQDGQVLRDHSSRGSSGNERVVITRYSNPPLQTGTWFVSLLLYDTNAAAEGTLTATLGFDEEPPPARVSGGPLTPGRPAAFRLGPVTEPTLFNGDNSFHLEAPEGAVSVTFTVTSDDPDVDVDLYVRFGEDTELRDGSVVRDYSSRRYSGNEEIGITRYSDPPLQIGTYFVSLEVYDTGVIAEGTVTAQVGTLEDCHLDAACYPAWSRSAAGVAQIVFAKEGGFFICSGALLNNRREDFTPYFLTAAHCLNSDEQARSVTAFWLYRKQACNAAPPARSSAPRTSGARLLATLGGALEGRPHPDGDMTLLQLEGELPDGVVFQGWDADPQPREAQVAGIHHPGNDLWGAFKRIAFGRIASNPGGVFTQVVHTQGYTEPGSSGSALFSAPETVIGALYGGETRENQNVCPLGLRDVYTSFSTFYPYIRQFIDSPLFVPLISSGGVVLAAGTPIVSRISPNAIVSVFGQAFAPQGTQARSPVLDAEGRIAAELAAACLEIDGKRAPLFAVFPTQINAQAPHDLQEGRASVRVVRGCGTGEERRSPAETVAIAAVSPMFFNFTSNPDGRNPVAALHGGGPGLAGAPGLLPGAVFTPAEPGEVVSLFGTGFGATAPRLEAGRIPGMQAALASEVSFTFGGIAVPPEDVIYAGAAPCCAGLYRFAVRVPPDVPDGDAPVRATVQGIATPPGPFLTVRRQ